MSKIGSFFHKLGDTLAEVAPDIIKYIPGIPSGLKPIIVDAISEAHQLGPVDGETGEARNARQKRHVVAIVSDAIKTNNIARPESPIDAASVLVAVDEGIDATVRSVKAVHQARTNIAAKLPAGV